MGKIIRCKICNGFLGLCQSMEEVFSGKGYEDYGIEIIDSHWCYKGEKIKQTVIGKGDICKECYEKETLNRTSLPLKPKGVSIREAT